MSLVLQKEDERFRDLINLGKQRGYVSYDEVSEVLPAETRTSADIESLFSELEHEHVPVYEDAPLSAAAPADSEGAGFDGGEGSGRGPESDFSETAHSPDKTNDPVRLYLREMGSVPLLKREDEVAIAKRMERGRALVLKTLARSPLVVEDLIRKGEEIRSGDLSVREVVHFDEDELTVEKIEAKKRLTLKTLQKLEKLYALALRQAARLRCSGRRSPPPRTGCRDRSRARGRVPPSPRRPY